MAVSNNVSVMLNGKIINTLTQAISQEYKTALLTAKANTENSFAFYLSIAKIFTDKNDDLTIVMDGINILQYKYKYIGGYAGNYTDYLGNSVFFALAKTDNKSISISPIANHNFLAPLYSKNTNIFEQPYYHLYNNKVYVFKKAGIIEEDSKYTMPTVKKNTLRTH